MSYLPFGASPFPRPEWLELAGSGLKLASPKADLHRI